MTSRVIWAWGAGLLTLACGASLVWRLFGQGYLPQPFYYHPNDTLMDLYSTAFWANTTQAYERWHAIYPPLSFAMLKVFSTHWCYATGAMGARSCDWLPTFWIFPFFVLNVSLLIWRLRAVDRSTALPRAILLSAGLPMLYALERGNLLIPTMTAYLLAVGAGPRSRPLRWAAMAIAINFKPYVLIAAFGRFARRDWRWFAGVGAIALVIYGVSYEIYGSGAPDQIVGDESVYAVERGDHFFADLYYATSYWPLLRLLRAAPTGLRLLDPSIGAGAALALGVVIRLMQLAAAVSLVLALLRPARVDARRFGVLFVGLALTAFTTGSAGYTQTFLFFLLFMEPRRGGPYALITACVYLLSVPVDWVILPVIHGPVQSFLTGRRVVADFGVSVGQLARPALLLVIQTTLTVVNLRDLLGPADGGVAVKTPSR